jgi:hypothetical protein
MLRGWQGWLVGFACLGGAGCGGRAVPLTPPGYWDRPEVKKAVREAGVQRPPAASPGGADAGPVGETDLVGSARTRDAAIRRQAPPQGDPQ